MTHEGDLNVGTADELEEARRYGTVTGTLVLQLPSVELPQLTHVGGALSAFGVEQLRLPNLTDVGGQIYFYLDDKIESLDFRSLSTVGEGFYVSRNVALRELQIDSLKDVGGDVEISANLQLADCYLDLVSERFSILHTLAPACECSRNCGFVTATCH